MKTLRTLFVIAIAIIGFTTTSFGQTNTVDNATATAIVKKTLTIQQTTPLSFGTFGALADGPSTVVLSSTDNSRTGSSADLIGNDGVTGVFTITGEPEETVALTAPGEVILDGQGDADGEHMTIASDAWTYSVENLPVENINSIGLTAVTGVTVLKVGATLTVNQHQAAGTYRKTYTLTVNYN